MDATARPIYDHAGFWWRVLALLLDGIIIAFACQAASFIMGSIWGPGTDHIDLMNWNFKQHSQDFGPGGVLLRSSDVTEPFATTIEVWA